MKIDWKIVKSKIKTVVAVVWKYFAKYALIAGIAFILIRFIISKFLMSDSEKVKKIEKHVNEVKEKINIINIEKEKIKVEHEEVKKRREERDQESKKYFPD
jgi:uncharacterized membrane protein (DUF106 family)